MACNGHKRRKFERYLRLALSYTQPQRPALFITHGLSGSGKSTLSGPLVEPLAAIRIRSDRERQRMFGKGKREGGAVTIGEGCIPGTPPGKPMEACGTCGGCLQSGYSVIIDATFLERQQRDEFKQLADRVKAPIHILFFMPMPMCFDSEFVGASVKERHLGSGSQCAGASARGVCGTRSG